MTKREAIHVHFISYNYFSKQLEIIMVFVHNTQESKKCFIMYKPIKRKLIN